MSARPVATGSITLDREKAKEKLRRFQLADPCAWLLELVRAAASQGASFVTVRTDADDVRVAFDGRPFTAADLENLYEALLARGAPPGRQHLAVALNGALALGPRFVELGSGAGGQAVKLRLVPGKPDALGPCEDAKAPPGTTLWLRQPFRAGAFLEFFRARLGTQREITALRRGCRFSPLPVTINQRVVAWAPPAERVRKVQANGVRGALVLANLEDSADAPGVLVFTYRGVVLEELAHPLMPAGLVAMLPADHLTRDASLGAFLRDDRWCELVDAALLAALELCEQERGAWLARATWALGPSALRLEAGDSPLNPLPRLRAALGKTKRPLFRETVAEAVNGDDVSLGDLHALLRRGQSVAVSSRRSKAPRRGEPIVRADGEAAMARLIHFVGTRHRPGDEALEEAERRHHGLQRLHERRAPLALFPGEVLGQARWAAQQARGIVGLSAAGSRLRLVFFTDGCMIGMHDLDCPLPGLTMAIEAPFALTPDCTDVVRDGVFTRALRAAFAALPDALADACARGRKPELLARRALPMLALALGAEALWAKLAAAAGCPILDDLPPLPPLMLEGVDAHPVCALPCLPRVDTRLSALAELRGQTVCVVPQDTVAFSRPEAIRSGEVLRAVIERVARLDVQDELARRESRRAQLLQAPSTLREPYPPAVGFRVGDVGAGWVAFGGGRPGVSLEAHIEGRAVTPVHFGDAHLGALRIVVDDPLLLPLPDGSVAAVDVRRLVRAGLAAAGGLIETAAGGPGASFPGRRLALALLTVVAPTLPLARAAEKLRVPEFLALRALTLATESRDVGALIELALEAGNRPTVEIVRELAHAAGTRLPKRAASDADARAFVLAPLGGLRGLREMDASLSLAERVLRKLPSLSALELRSLDGVVTLRSILGGATPVSYVPSGWLVPDGADPQGRVLVLTQDELSALNALLGPSSLVDATTELRERAARRAHREKPVEEPRLDRRLHLGVDELELAGTRGELGLLPPSLARPTAHVRLLCGGRFVRRLDLSAVAPCSFAAVVDDPTLPLIDSPVASERAAHVGAHCVAVAERVLDSLVASLAAERPDPRVRACLLERLSLHDAHPIELQRLGRLSQAPLVDTIHGRWVSFDAVLAEVQRHRSVACVAVAPKGEPPRELVLVMPASHHRDLLARAGAPVEDVTTRWHQHAERQRALGRHPALPRPPDDAFAVAEAAVAGVRVCLWVGPETRGELVAAGIDQRQIGVVALESVLPAVEGAVTGEPVVDPTLSFVHLTRAWPAIDVAVVALAARMVELLPPARGASDMSARHEWCRRLSLSLSARPDAHGKRLGPLLKRLNAIPLFAGPDDGLLSLEQVLATRPARYEAELIAAGLAPPPAIAVAPPPEPPPPPPPEELMTTRVQELLALLALDDETQADLARFPLLVVRRKGKALVRFTRRHCEVDVEHELGRAALEGDPAALDLLAAVVVGAANHHLDEIDARHERQFLARLLSHAATRDG